MTSASRRGRLLNAVLLIAALFYLLSPGIFAYFSQATMFYSRVPKWFAATPPAQLTIRIFDRYNANAPLALRVNERLTCEMIDEGAERLSACAHEVHPGEIVHGPSPLKVAGGLKMAAGSYVLRAQFGTSERCTTGTARLRVMTTGRFGSAHADETPSISGGAEIEVPFRLSAFDAAFGYVEFTVTGVSGCVILTGAQWHLAT